MIHERLRKHHTSSRGGKSFRGGRGGKEEEQPKQSEHGLKSGVALRFAKTHRDKLSLMLSFFSKYIHECIEKDKGLLKKEFTSPKALLYQMYFVINKLDESRLYRMDFLVNFGVSLEDIRHISEALEDGGNYDDVKEHTFKHLPFLTVLKINKYFSWADKKLH